MNNCKRIGPVNRRRPLPVGELHGQFIVPENVIHATRVALEGFARSGMRDGGHEGLVFWAGRELQSVTVYVTVVIPDSEHSWGRVLLREQALAAAARVARRHGLALLCQVHSHPGADTRHSDGDDDLVVMPFGGMLSIVVPHYGLGFSSIRESSVHQFQDGRWVLCTLESVEARLLVAPLVMDVR